MATKKLSASRTESPSLWDDMAVASRAFRLGVEGQGSDALIRCIDQMGLLLEALPKDEIQAVNRLLLTLFDAQQSKDFILVADLLEHDLGDILRKMPSLK